MSRNTDVGVLLKNISDAIESSANAELSELGLTVAQFRYLEYVQKNPDGISAKELMSYFAVSQPTVAGVVKRLRAKGYLTAEVSKEDERTKDITITGAGVEIVQQASSHKAITEEKILSALSTGERKLIKELLLKVYYSFYPEGGISHEQ